MQIQTFNRRLGLARRGLNAHKVKLVEFRVKHDFNITADKLSQEYGITRYKAIAFTDLLKPRIVTGVCFGSKFEAYYTEEEALQTPTYSVGDLKGEELEMLLNEKSTR